MNDGIKTQLFSFKTFRSPDKIGEDEQSFRFWRPDVERVG